MTDTTRKTITIHTPGGSTVLWSGEQDRLQEAFDLFRAAGTSCRELNLFGFDLRGLNLGGLDLSGSGFYQARCSGTDFSGSRLTGTDFTFADLTFATLDQCDLTGALFNRASLRGASLRGVTGVPVLDDIHRKVYEAARVDGALDMTRWHACETTHCRAGWVNHLAGARGLEVMNEPNVVAHLIYLASDPEHFSGKDSEPLPDFYTNNDEALRDMARLAGVGA